MNWLVYHIASGQAFFSGVALIILAALASTCSRPIAKRLTGLAFVIGVIAVAISSTPIPYWYYAIASVVTVAWLVSGYLAKWRRWTRIAVIAVWSVAAAIELPYHFTPSLAPASSPSIAVIADSITAGMGGGDQSVRWPTTLAKEHNLNVQDMSYPGETAASALKRAKSRQIACSVAIVEIGGNDLLGDTSSDEFAQALDALLAYVSAPAARSSCSSCRCRRSGSNSGAFSVRSHGSTVSPSFPNGFFCQSLLRMARQSIRFT